MWTRNLNNVHTHIPASVQTVHAALVHISHLFCLFLTASVLHHISCSIGLSTTFTKPINYLQTIYKIKLYPTIPQLLAQYLQLKCWIQTQNDKKKFQFGGSGDWRQVLKPISFITRILRYVYVKAHAMSATPLTAVS
jgi:hypothetical protein